MGLSPSAPPSAWAELLGELYGLAPRGIQPGLDRVREALRRVGDPQRAFDVVHIAGTNGKGSVAAMIAAGLVSSRVGRFTSPHLHSLTERIVVHGEPVSRELLSQTWRSIREPVAGVPLTFFETVTVLAFVIFEQRGVQLAVLETGLGGRLDSTNVSERKVLTAITRVALDHRSWLGDDLAGIAREKAGILVSGVPCVVGAQLPVVDAEIDAIAAELGASLHRPRTEGGSVFRVIDADRRSSPLELELPGEHQRENAAVAVAALWRLEEAGFAVDLDRAMQVRWPGRLERLPGRPEVLLDVAHNPNAAVALARHLERREAGATSPKKPVLVFGAMQDKNWLAMLAALRGHFSRVVLTKAPLGRAQEPSEMAEPGDLVEPVVTHALARARELATEEGLVVVAGSSFVVAEARAHLLGIEADPPIAF